ncbi:MAG: zinc-ribbon domain-containing protein [Nitrospiraceae bacterium]|nr:zinc-ribbon domain-containing protein [Nitrospiraceae bacterium]
MVVSCPKCAIKLKVDETKLSPEGSKFKCPKCSAVLVVRKPSAQPKKDLNRSAILVAHSNPGLLKEIVSILAAAGYKAITAADGIDLMVKALKEFPFLAVIEVALPKIYGFEVCRRLKGRVETKDMKFILIPAIHDKTKYRREPTSLYGADDYIEEFDISAHLLEKVQFLLGGGVPETGQPEREEKPEAAQKPSAPAAQAAIHPSAAPATTPPSPAGAQADEKVEKARRLARTIINDIHLYNTAKVEAAIRAGDFYAVFGAEIKEGKKLYDTRVSQEVRETFDYYREAIDNFIAAKKASLQ